MHLLMKQFPNVLPEGARKDRVGAQEVSWDGQIKLGLACLAVAGIVAWFNRFHELQSGIYDARYLGLAKFLLGEPAEPVITYPLWGYPLVLSWLPAPESTSIALQLTIATITLVVVYSSAAPFLRLRTALAILCIVAVPWYALASVKLADIYSASFGVMAICLLARAIKTGELRWTVLSGVLLGASLNFRSDFLAVFCILLLLATVFSPRTVLQNRHRLLVILVLAVILLAPWGIFRVHHGKSFGLTSTNAGMVLYNSLGFPGNSWGVVFSDDARTAEVREALGAHVDPTSEEGNAFFQKRFLAAVSSHPGEFCRKVAYNFIAALKLGFYTVETWTFLSPEERLQFEILKEQLKLRTGAKPYLSRIEDFRSRGLWNENFSLTSVTPRQWAWVAFPIVNSALSTLYLVTVLLVSAGMLTFDRRRLGEPIFLFCLVGTLSVFVSVTLIQYEPRQVNALYPLGMPLIIILGEWIAEPNKSRLRRWSVQRCQN